MNIEKGCLRNRAAFFYTASQAGICLEYNLHLHCYLPERSRQRILIGQLDT
jgi:hypothetical protein